MANVVFGTGEWTAFDASASDRLIRARGPVRIASGDTTGVAVSGGLGLANGESLILTGGVAYSGVSDGVYQALVEIIEV